MQVDFVARLVGSLLAQQANEVFQGKI